MNRKLHGGILCALLLTPPIALAANGPQVKQQYVRNANPPVVQALTGKRVPTGHIPGWITLNSTVWVIPTPTLRAMGVEFIEQNGTFAFIVGRVDGAARSQTVLDAQVLPPQPHRDQNGRLVGSRAANARLYRFQTACMHSDRTGETQLLVGTAHVERGKACPGWTQNVQQAWRIDPHTGRISEISPQGISCFVGPDDPCAQ